MAMTVGTNTQTRNGGLWNIAAEEPDRIALVDAIRGEHSFGELASTANKYGRGLHDMGLRPGDSVVMMLHNSADLVAFYFAALQTGLYIVAVNWHLTGPEVAYILKDSEAKAFVASDRFAEAAACAGAAGSHAREVRRVLPPLHDPRGRAVPARGRATHARVVGACGDRMLRSDGGRWDRHLGRSLVAQTRIGRHCLAQLRDQGAR